MKKKSEFDYEVQTRNAYQDRKQAAHYVNAYEGPLNLSTLHRRIIASRERRLLSKALGICTPAPRSILDVPCGTGKLAKVLGRLNLIRVIGADISLEMMERAKQAFVALKPFAGFVQCDGTQLPFPDRSHDAVTCLRLLHRTPPTVRTRIVAELQRVAKRHIVVSYGITSGFQSLRMRIRQWFARATWLPYPVLFEEAVAELQDGGWKLVRHYRVLRGLSSEVLFLLERQDN